MPAVTDYQNATANFSTQFYDNSELMNTGSQQLQYIQDTIQSHQVNQEQLQQAARAYNPNIPSMPQYQAVNNFNSNDTNILQKKLMELQAELGELDKEYEQLVDENTKMQEQNDRIKTQNKKIFEKITSH